MTPQGAVLVFWSSVALIAYGYLGYPVLVYLLGRLRGRPHLREEITPRISLLVPAYNEGAVVRAKIHNCTQLDYPREQLEVFMASDGSTDGTSELIAEAGNAGLLRGVVYQQRRGKAAVLNDLVAKASGEILVFSDASTMLDRGSLRALASNFADARVGCVSGIYRVVPGDRQGSGGAEAVYWRYETFIRHAEARLGSMLGAHGALYAIRRELFEPLDAGTRNEDFILPVIILMKGYRSVYDIRAVATEDAGEMTGFSRRVSLAAGNYQQMALLWKRGGWLRKPFLVFQLWSHKGLRLVTPLLLLGMYLSNLWLVSSAGYRAVFAAQTVFFTAALLGAHPRLRRWGRALVAAPYYFCMAHAAGVVALQRMMWGKTFAGQRAPSLLSHRK